MCSCRQNAEIDLGAIPMNIELTSTAFQDGGAIPKQYTGDGGDVSPPLRWNDSPPKTKSLSLICEDPDAPRGTFTHWLLFNLPAETRELTEGVAPESTRGDGS